MHTSHEMPRSLSEAHAEEIVEKARRDGVKLIRFAYCDLAGITRCKAIHISQLRNKLLEGVGLSRAQMALNVMDELIDVEGMAPVGEIRLLADPSTYSVSSWVESTATVLCDQVGHDREDWGACPRTFLKRTLAQLADRGIQVRAGVEAEFYLAPFGLTSEDDELFTHLPRTPVYSTIGHDASAAVLLDIVDTLTAQGTEVEQAINEYGPGQQEVAIRHRPALAAADDFLTVKDVVRGVSRARGFYASFAPKPFLDQIGSGAHLHVSLWSSDNRQNLLFDAGSPLYLSQLGRHFIAGIRAHLPALVAITAPSVNSYRRISAGAWASSSTSWGFDNREAALRVASPFHGREEQTFNLEYKPMDASANPYLAFGAILRAGLDGIDRSLELPPPTAVDPARLTHDEREQRSIVELPGDLGAAIANFRTDELLTSLFGKDLLLRGFLAVRRSEIDAFADRDAEYEAHHHFFKY